MFQITIARVCLTLFLTVFISFFSIAFCQQENEFKIIKQDGIAIASNPDHPVPTKISPKDISFKEKFKIGAIEGDPEYIFGEFISYTVDDKNCVYILDWRSKTVRKFDPNGEHLLSFGREGQGPGEFSFPEEIQFLSNGSLVVFEGETQKYSYFSKKGEFLKSARFQRLMYSPYFGLSSGHFIASSVHRDEKKVLMETGVFSEKSELIKSLHQTERRLDSPQPPQDDSDARAKRIADFFSRAAFRPSVVVSLNEKEEIYCGYSDTYEIKIYSRDVELQKIIRTNLPAISIEKSDKERFFNFTLPRELSTWNTLDNSFRNRIKSLIRFPKKKAAFLSFIPMDAGYLMVLRDGGHGQNALVDIFDPSGRFIVEKRLDFPIQSGIFRGGQFYTIFTDADGFPYVKCYHYKLE
jgi:hypothetical protein